MLGHSGAVGLVVQDALLPVAEQALAEVGPVRVRGVIGGARRTAGTTSTPGPPTATTASPTSTSTTTRPLQLMYTSGTESRPKGVVMTSRMLVAQYVSCVVDGGMEAGDVEVHSLPLYHCAQLHCFLVPDVYLGATSIVLPGPDPALLLRTIEQERVTKLFAPPTVWISLLRHPDFDTADLSSLRKGYYGASAMPVPVLHEMLERLPQVRLWNFYGQTEMAPVATILGPDEQLSHAGSAGRAVLNVETVVVDDDGVEVPRGTVGEIVHRGPHATPGYWEDDDKTAEAFAHGWFHSGDLGVVERERPPVGRRPQEGHDQDRRRERREPRGRGGAARPPRRRRGRRVRRAAPGLDRGRDGGRRREAGGDADRGGARRALPRAPGRLQDAQAGRGGRRSCRRTPAGRSSSASSGRRTRSSQGSRRAPDDARGAGTSRSGRWCGWSPAARPRGRSGRPGCGAARPRSARLAGLAVLLGRPDGERAPRRPASAPGWCWRSTSRGWGAARPALLVVPVRLHNDGPALRVLRSEV